MPDKPETIDQYLSNVRPEQRAALQELREAIQSAAPDAEECISYDIPGFRLGGKLLVSFGAAKKHCAFYPGAHPIRTHKDELKAYDATKGTIRVQPERPLPATLVRKLVKTRIAEQASKRTRRPS